MDDQTLKKILKTHIKIDSETLKSLIEIGPCKNLDLIIIDIRPREDFAKGHIAYEQCICIPSTDFSTKSTVHAIQKSLADANDAVAWRLWKDYQDVHKVIIYDEEESFYRYPPDDKLRVLFKLIRGNVDRFVPAILKGGFRNFSETFPELISSEYSSGEFAPGELPPKRPTPYVPQPRNFESMESTPEERRASIASAPPAFLKLLKDRSERRMAEKARNSKGSLPVNLPAVKRGLLKGTDIKPISKRAKEIQEAMENSQEVVSNELPEQQKLPEELEVETVETSSESESGSEGTVRLEAQVSVPILLPRGIINSGNSCYIGSVLQSLRLTEQFFPQIRHWTSQVAMNSAECQWTNQVLTVLKELEAKQTQEPISIVGIKNLALADKNCAFGEGGQHDAYEFLGFLLARIDEELSAEDLESPLEELFEITSIDRIRRRCRSCQSLEESEKEQKFCVVSLSLANEAETSLKTSLEMYTNEEELSETPQCLSCAEEISSTHQILFSQLPRYLILHLKRFSSRMKPSKNPKKLDASIFKLKTRIAFPEGGSLDLGPFITEAVNMEPRAGFSFMYSIYAIVNHIGEDMDSGHYTVYGKSEGKWIHYNDSVVQPVTLKELDLGNAYLIFLERTY